MAGSGAGGYNYDFVSELPDRLNCSICLFALRNPVQFMGCGHRFCKLCVDPILSSPQARCPIDRTVASKDKVFEDVACHREVLELHVECPIDNCLWTGKLADVENYKVHCPKKTVGTSRYNPKGPHL